MSEIYFDSFSLLGVFKGKINQGLGLALCLKQVLRSKIPQCQTMFCSF